MGCSFWFREHVGSLVLCLVVCFISTFVMGLGKETFRAFQQKSDRRWNLGILMIFTMRHLGIFWLGGFLLFVRWRQGVVMRKVMGVFLDLGWRIFPRRSTHTKRNGRDSKGRGKERTKAGDTRIESVSLPVEGVGDKRNRRAFHPLCWVEKGRRRRRRITSVSTSLDRRRRDYHCSTRHFHNKERKNPLSSSNSTSSPPSLPSLALHAPLGATTSSPPAISTCT